MPLNAAQAAGSVSAYAGGEALKFPTPAVAPAVNFTKPQSAPEPDRRGLLSLPIESAAVQPVVPKGETSNPGTPQRVPAHSPRWVKLKGPDDFPDVHDEPLTDEQVHSWVEEKSRALRGSSSQDVPLSRAQALTPTDNAVNAGVTPAFTAKVLNPHPILKSKFLFRIYNSGTLMPENEVANSGWLAQGKWVSPAGKLKANTTYWWTVEQGLVADDNDTPIIGELWPPYYVFSTGATLNAPNSATAALTSPADGAVLNSKTPELKAAIVRPAKGANYQYQFTVQSFDGKLKWESDWLNAPSVVVPANVLYWNRGYTWRVSVRDNPYIGELFHQRERTFYPVVPPAPGIKPSSDRLAPVERGVNVASGIFTATATDAILEVAGGNIELQRSYRSSDTAARAFGMGWSSLLDMRVFNVQGAVGPVVRFADGSEETYGTNPNGTYASGPGALQTTLSKCATCTAYTLVETTGNRYEIDEFGIVSLSNASGNKLVFVRDPGTKQVTQIVDNVTKRKLAFTRNGSNIASVTALPAPVGARMQWRYEYKSGVLVKSCSPVRGTAERCLTYTPHAANAPTPHALASIVNPSGAVSERITYGAGGVAAQRTDAAGTTWSFARKPSGSGILHTVTGPTGSWAYQLDGLQRLVSATDAKGGIQRWQYDAAGRLGLYVSAAGGKIQLSYNQDGKIAQRLSWRDTTTATVQCYDYWESGPGKEGRLKATLDPRTVPREGCLFGEFSTPLRSFDYDADGRVTTIQAGKLASGAPKTTYAYTSPKDGAVGGGTTPAGLLKVVTQSAGEKTTYGYDSAGQVRTKTETTGLQQEYTYDSLGRLRQSTATVRQKPATTEYAWFDDSTLESITGPREEDPVSGITRQMRTTTTTNADGFSETTTTSDLVSGKSLVSKQKPDVLGRPIEVTGPDGVVKGRYTYHHLGGIEDFTDAAGAVRHTTFDALGRPERTEITNYVDPATGEKRPVVLSTSSYTPDGLPDVVTDAHGQTWKYTYSRDGLETSATALKAGPDGKDLLVRKVGYNALGRPENIESNAGRKWQFLQYGALGELENVQEPGRETVYQRDRFGRLESVTVKAPGSSDAWVSTQKFDAASRPVGHTTSRGGHSFTSWTVFDEAGNLKFTTDPRSEKPGDPQWTTTYDTDSSGRTVRTVAPAVDVVTAESKERKPLETAFGFDEFGRPSVTRDARGDVVSLFNLNSQVEQITYPRVPLADGSLTNPVVKSSYDEAGRLSSRTNAAGHQVTYLRDILGLLTERKDTGPEGKTRTWTARWTDAGLPSVMAEPGGLRREYTYDTRGQLRATAELFDNQKAVTSFIRDEAGNPTSVTSPEGGVTKAAYDPFNQPEWTQDPDGVRWSYTYDVMGNQVQADSGKGPKTINEYDAASRLVKQTKSNTSGDVTTAWTYDNAGNLTSTTNPLGKQIQWSWDASNANTSKTYADTTKVEFGYDPSRNLTAFTDGNGHTTRFGWDPRGLLTSVVEPSTATHRNDADRTWAHGYDIAGHRVRSVAPGGVETVRVFDADGQLRSETANGGGVEPAQRAFTYDVMGRLSTVSHPSGVQTFTHDARGLMTASSGPAGAMTAAFDLEGRETNRTDAAGSVASTWTPGGRLKTLTNGATTRAYSHYDVGRVKTENISGVGVRTFNYDHLNRMIGDDLPGVLSWSGEYDKAGNLTSATRGPFTVPGAGTSKFSYDDRDRLRTWTAPDSVEHAYEHDKAGNLTVYDGQRQAFDERNRLLNSGDTAYAWSPRGTRTASTLNGVETAYGFDGFDQLRSVGQQRYSYDGLGRVADGDGGLRSYAGLGREPVKTGSDPLSRTPSGDVFASGANSLIHDFRGDIAALVVPGAKKLSDGAVSASRWYAPFGKQAGGAGQIPGDLGHQSQYGARGSTHMGARWHDDSTGTFTSRDRAPVGVEEWNRYSYARGNPQTYSDPSGNTVCAIPLVGPTGCGAAGGAALGGPIGAVVGGALGLGTAIGAGYLIDKAVKGMAQDTSAPAYHGRATTASYDVGAIDFSMPSISVPSVSGSFINLSGINATVAGITATVAGISATVASINALAKEIDATMAYISSITASINAITWGITNWYKVPDHSSTLRVSDARALSAPTGALSAPFGQMCSASPKTCQGGVNLGVGPITLPISIATAYAVSNPAVPTPESTPSIVTMGVTTAAAAPPPLNDDEQEQNLRGGGVKPAQGSIGAGPSGTTNSVRYGPLNPGPLSQEVGSSFRSSSYTMTKLSEETTLYRVYGGNAGRLGSYWTRTNPTGPLQSQLDSALNPAWGNSATKVTTIRVPSGTTIYEGFAAEQPIAGGGMLPGGGSQVYIPRVDISWLVP